MKVGILGTGFGISHAEIYKNMEGVEIAGLFGRNEEKLKHLSKVFQTKVTQNIYDIIHDPEIELIDICLPTNIHTKYIIESLKAGKHVLCETPLCYTREELAFIKNAEQKYGKRVFVDHFIKFDPAYQYLYHAIKDNIYGKLISLTISRKTPPVWGSLGLDTIIINLMLHDLDCSFWLLGMPAGKSITSVSVNQDEAYVNAALHYHGSILHVAASSMMPKSYPFTTGYEAVFENGMLDYQGSFTSEGLENRLMEYTSSGKQEHLLKDHNPYEYALRHVIECCKTNKDTILSADIAAASLNMAFELNAMLNC